jgi:Family of unknown function (DUF6600)
VRKPVVLGTLFLAGLVSFGAAAAANASASVNLSFFHETLAPHGRWVATVSYGEVWVPAVSAGWAPYVNGEWLYTDWGWTWVSDDPWGEIPFHYGTWVWVSHWGWAWVPGTVWAPAWVTWAYTNDCVGWAPVPTSFVLTASGYFGRPVVVAETRYVFVPARQFVGVRVTSVRMPPRRNAALLAEAHRVTAFQVTRGYVRNVGPPTSQVEKAVGRRIPQTAVASARVRPTTLADSGFTRASRMAVVAPAGERARMAPAGSVKSRGGKPGVESTSKKPKERSSHPAAPERSASVRRESPAAVAVVAENSTRSTATSRPAPAEKKSPTREKKPESVDRKPGPSAPPAVSEARAPASPQADRKKVHPSKPKPAPHKPDQEAKKKDDHHNSHGGVS